jgi:glycosyltransferase involved in cell wall biosynthesis
MKVIIVTPHFYPNIGGVEAYTLNVARQMKDLGWEVVIVTTGDYNAEKTEEFEGMTLYRLNVALIFSNTPIGFGWRRELTRIFQVEQPDLINAHTPVPYLADMAQRASRSIPFILTYHNDLVKDRQPYKIIAKALNIIMIKRTLSRSTRIIATSEYYAENSVYLKCHKSKVDIVPPGVTLSRFNPNITVSDELAAHYEGKRLILFVGSVNRSHQHKGIDILINAFALIHRELPDVRLVIVGKGDGMDMYRSLATAAGVAGEVDFTGYVDDDTLAQYYRLATVFAMPSTNRSEGFGMVYMEAGAVGVPVVGSRVGGVPYAVKDNETGLLVEPKSVQSLYRALRRVLVDRALANRLGSAGSARAAADFDWRLLTQRTSAIFSNVSSSSGCRQVHRL